MHINKIKFCIIFVSFLTFLSSNLKTTLIFIVAISSKKVKAKKIFDRKLVRVS